MGNGIYLAGAAMVSRQVWQDAVVNNLANASTPGYKATRVFAELLDEVGASVDAMRETERNQKFYVDFTQGPIEDTGRDLDLALQGEGFFVVQTDEGERFTRNGNFSLDAEGRLVTQWGDPVLTESGPIVLGDLDRAGAVTVREDGEIFVEDRLVGRLRIRAFASPEDLRKEDRGLFGVEPGSSLKEVEPKAAVRQRSLERSNVEPMDEMVRMMTQFRSYEACQRMVEMQDQAQRQTVSDLITR
jgi:flagellar basal-body rod protein FlgF